MTTHLNHTMLTDKEDRRPRWLGVACATALTVAAVGGLGGLQLREHVGVGSNQSARQPATAGTSTTESTMHTAGMAPHFDMFAAEYSYILVPSEQQAAAVRRLVAHANELRVRAGQRPAIITVLVTEGLDPAALTVVWEQPGVPVVDLREP